MEKGKTTPIIPAYWLIRHSIEDFNKELLAALRRFSDNKSLYTPQQFTHLR